MPLDYVYGLIGGVLIGIAAAAFLVLSGRVAGISGILGGALEPGTESSERRWRLWFLAGLLVGGLAMLRLYPQAYPPAFALDGSSSAILVAAGLLVGFGTRLGSGCTSGHGVCGIGRLSPRSLAATVTFIALGAAVVALIRGLS